MDGGVTNHTPLATAVSLGASRIIVLPSGFACALDTAPRGMIAVALHALTLLIARQLVNDVERFQEQTEVVVIPPLCPLGVSSYDFSHSLELIERAAQSTTLWLESGGLRNRAISAELRRHHH